MQVQSLVKALTESRAGSDTTPCYQHVQIFVLHDVGHGLFVGDHREVVAVAL